jgi:hypothetical protein
LPEGDPGRQQKFTYQGEVFEFKDACDVATPKLRDMELVQAICTIATEKKPILGHKFPPVICCWPEFDWQRVLTAAEVMHGR